LKTREEGWEQWPCQLAINGREAPAALTIIKGKL
jgi:hypothetical protein